MKPRGAQARMRFQSLAYEPKIGIEHRGAQLLGAMKTLDLDRPLHRIGMKAERLGNRAHLPVLSIKIAADLNTHLRIDHLCLICEPMYAEKDRPGDQSVRRPCSADNCPAGPAIEYATAQPPAS